jgi:hypothetical protein
MRTEYRLENLKTRDHLEDLCLCGWVAFKWLLKKEGGNCGLVISGCKR